MSAFAINVAPGRGMVDAFMLASFCPWRGRPAEEHAFLRFSCICGKRHEIIEDKNMRAERCFIPIRSYDFGRIECNNCGRTFGKAKVMEYLENERPWFRLTWEDENA